MEAQEIDKGKQVVVVGELPFLYDPQEPAVQQLLKRSSQVSANATTVEIKILESSKVKKKAK